MTKTARILIPVTEKEKKALKELARKEGYMSLSAYLRDKGLDKQKED